MASRADIEAGKAHVRLYLKNSELVAGLANLRKRMTTLGQDLKSIGQQFASFGIAIGGTVGLGVKRFADFDDQMRVVRSVSQSTEAEFRQLTDTAKRLGATTSFTAVEVAGIMAELGKAGFVADEVDVMTEAVLNLSRATATDAVTASGAMAATLRQFGLGANDATRVSDLLTVAANASFNSVESLSEALGYAGPVASDLGMSLEETLAILGGLGNVGIQGSEAGTALRRLLTLSGAEATKLKSILGVSFTDAAGNIRPLVDSLAEVNQVTAGMSSGMRAAKFNEAFGLLGITGASVIGNSSLDIANLRKQLDGSAGTAAKAAKEMDQGLGGSLRRTLSAVEGVAIALGDALDAGLQDVIASIVEFADWLRQTIEANQSFVQQIAMVIGGITGLGVGLMAIGGAISLFSSAIGLALVPLGMLGTALSVLVSPFAIITAGVVAWGVALVKYTDLGKRAFEAVATYLSGYLQVIGDTIAAVKDALSRGDLAAAATVAWAGLKVIFLTGLRDITSKMNLVFGDLFYRVFTGDFAGAFAEAVQLLEAVWLTFVSGMVNAFASAMNGVFDSIREVAAVLKLVGMTQLPGAAMAAKIGKAIDKGIPKDLEKSINTTATNYREKLAQAQAEVGRTADLNQGAADADLLAAQKELADAIYAARSPVASEAKKPTAPKPGSKAEAVPAGSAAAMVGAAATATFSAAQIQAGFGGTAEKTLEEMKAMRKSTEKNEAAAREVRDALLKIPLTLSTLMPRFA